jgi:phosphoserine phosphatase RsbU/P
MQLAAVVLGAFRRAASTAPLVGCVANEVDAVVGGVVGDEDFVTAVVAEFHPDRTVAVVKCGHPPPVKVSARWRSAGPAWVGTVNYDRP